MAKFIVFAAFVLHCHLSLASAMTGSAILITRMEDGSGLPPLRRSAAPSWLSLQCLVKNDEMTSHDLAKEIHAIEVGTDQCSDGVGCRKIYCIACKGAKDLTKPSLCKGQHFILVRVQGLCSNSGIDFCLTKGAFDAIADSTVVSAIKVDYALFSSSKNTCDWKL